MKFSEVEEATWSELSPYYDTCLIPYTGLSGKESPIEATEALARLRDFMDLVEIPFKGRIITYPAVQYGQGEDLSLLQEVCHNVREAGFAYVIVMTADIELIQGQIEGCDLVLSRKVVFNEETGGAGIAGQIKDKIQEMWQRDSKMEM
ncbi:DUF2487 family protein [Paenibacillus favisporus]|uniref:DUF2487 family protein n=1 Tax=Paenibacillus TaxID=44249 RepID=UPI00190AFDD6|nr:MULTISPECIES: DUF2487 family protein [Paenibacillus]MBJ9988518.1 DUF2487 family protein [Paenibacillus sp. S28]MEC0176507.1 DUF2487 family protein [Paenibacillus favisporus]